MTDDIKTVAPATASLSVRLNRLWLDAKALLHDGWRVFKQRFLNAETGLALWLLTCSPASAATALLAPEYAIQAMSAGMGTLGTALGAWLLWVNPVKREAKRQMAVARKLTDISIADYKKNSRSQTGAGVR